MLSWMRSNGSVRASMSASGELSRSEIGLRREISISEASHLAPLRMMLGKSALYTCSTCMFSQLSSRLPTARVKLSE